MLDPVIGLLNLGGGEIILIGAVLLIMLAVPVAIVLLILSIVRASQGKPRGTDSFTVIPSATNPPRDLEKELRTLAKLRDEGVITEEDFNLKKKALLGI